MVQCAIFKVGRTEKHINWRDKLNKIMLDCMLQWNPVIMTIIGPIKCGIILTLVELVAKDYIMVQIIFK